MNTSYNLIYVIKYTYYNNIIILHIFIIYNIYYNNFKTRNKILGSFYTQDQNINGFSGLFN